MLIRLGLIAAALVSMTVAFAASADAGQRWKMRYYSYDPDYDFYYGPEYVPQPRYYRYLRDRPAYYEEDEDDYAYEPDYYEPEYIPPRKKRKSYARPQIETKPAQTRPKTQAAKKKPTAISCAKAGQIVSGYGFKGVEQVSCKGQVYAFNATRDGKPFSVKLSAASGELTEVKKLKQ
ncbi:hypothetical protein [Taklimakanibacter deserti]|uniref:hypothetical protein n=1 Tax=Taklimakanibacter deserti TaxID=2267839 RepID=UPI000E658246